MSIIKNSILSVISILFSLTLHAQSLKKVQQIEGIPPKVAYRAIAHDDVDNMYVATSADVFLIPSNSNQAQPMSVGDSIVDVDWTADYGLILLSSDGTVHFTQTGKVLKVDSAKGATCLDIRKTMAWVGTHNGIYTISLQQEKIMDHYTTADGILASNDINFIFSDPYGLKWVGTQAGVVRIENKKWKLYEKDQAVTAITWTSDGAWIAADSMMWMVDQFNRWFTIDAWKELGEGRVKALSSDGKGLIYIASDVLVKYDPWEEKIVTMGEGSNEDQMILLSQGPSKSVWMAGSNGLARVIEDTSKIVKPVAKGDEMAIIVETKSKPVCLGMNTGHLVANVAGGRPPYTYQWSKNLGTGQEATGLAPGVYQVTVTDLDGKTILGSGIVSAAPAIKVTARLDTRSSDILAADGKMTALVEGGTSPFEYKWSDGEMTAQAMKLPEGNHTLTVIDANGCIANASVTMEGEKVLKSLDIATIAVGQTIRVDKLYFEADSATIEPASYPVLEEIYTFLNENPNVVIEIGGHTNSLPEDAYCDKLSTSRAQNVAEYLYQKGLPKDRISYKGYGKRQPIATNQTVEGRRKNQRVEIKIVSL